MAKVKGTDPYLNEEKVSKVHKSKHVTLKGYTSKNTKMTSK